MRIIAWVLLGVTIAAGVLHGLMPDVPVVASVVLGTWATGTALSGALVASRRPRNACGWLLLAAAAIVAVGAAILAYAQASVRGSRDWPLTEPTAWLSSWLFIPGFVCLGFLLLLYPDGHLVTSRWRWVAWLGVAGAGGLVVSSALKPGPLAAMHALDNPLGVDAERLIKAIDDVSSVAMTVFVVASFAALMVRYRRAVAAEREQLKWLLGAAAFAACGLLFAGVASEAANELSFFLAVAGLLAVPAAVAIGVLGYRLLDVDVVMNRTAVYVVLTLAAAAIYVLVATGFGTVVSEDVPAGVSLIAAALVAGSLLPMRSMLQRVVDRAMYGERSDPYAALSGLSRQLTTAQAPAEMLPKVAELVGRSLHLPYVRIDLRRFDRFEEVAVNGASLGVERVFDLTDDGELVGRLVVGLAPGERLPGRDVTLLRDLAVQVAALVRGARISQDLERSRAALVTTREAERRRMRRDLHDGLGPELAGIAFGLGAARNLLYGEPAAADALLERLQAQTRSAVGTVRGIVEGLVPPDLEQVGLVGAIRSGAARLTVEGGPCVLVEADDLVPLPAAVEVAGYRIAMEALANVVRHARAEQATVCLRVGGDLVVEVTDDGTGMPPTYVAGTGLTSMRDRAEELGGSCSIESIAGAGTRVVCRLPVAGD